MKRLRLRRRPAPEPGTVEVTITADVSRFVAKMEQAAEVTRVMRYRDRLAHERSLAQAHLGVQLDEWCLSYGWDPVHVWRAPRHREEQERRDRTRLALYEYASLAIGSRDKLITDVTS